MMLWRRPVSVGDYFRKVQCLTRLQTKLNTIIAAIIPSPQNNNKQNKKQHGICSVGQVNWTPSKMHPWNGQILPVWSRSIPTEPTATHFGTGASQGWEIRHDSPPDSVKPNTFWPTFWRIVGASSSLLKLQIFSILTTDYTSHNL